MTTEQIKAADGSTFNVQMNDTGGGVLSPGVTPLVANAPVATGNPMPVTCSQLPTVNGDGGAQAHIMNFPATQPVSAAALPLPAGAATAANQATTIASLNTIATNTAGTALETGGNLATIATNTTNGTKINAATIPAGGVGWFGWLSAIYWQLTQALTISGTVTANAGTNLNTSALALETGGNLATIATNTGTGAKINAATMPAGGSNFFGWLSAIYYQLTQTIAVSQTFRQAVVSVAPTNSASAYVNGYCVGGKLTFASMTDSQGTATLQSIRITCKSVQTFAWKVYVFDTNPSNTTWTDHATPAINAADDPDPIGYYYLNQPDSGLGTQTTWNLDAIGASVNPGANGSLYLVIVCVGAPTFGSTTDLNVRIGTLKD